LEMMRHPQRVARHAAVTRRRAVDVTDGRCLPASVSYHGCSWRGWKRSASSGRPDDFKSAVIQALFDSRRIDFLAARERWSGWVVARSLESLSTGGVAVVPFRINSC